MIKNAEIVIYIRVRIFASNIPTYLLRGIASQLLIPLNMTLRLRGTGPRETVPR